MMFFLQLANEIFKIEIYFCQYVLSESKHYIEDKIRVNVSNKRNLNIPKCKR